MKMLQNGIVNYVESGANKILNLPPDSLISSLKDEKKVVFKYYHYGIKVTIECEVSRVPAFIYNNLLLEKDKDRIQFNEFKDTYEEYFDNCGRIETEGQALVCIEDILELVYRNLLDEEYVRTYKGSTQLNLGGNR